MSEFKESDYVAEFVYRTKYNYFLVKEKTEVANIDEIEEQKNQLKETMKIKHFNTDDEAYEITQLLNSMIGLLILPQQRFFDSLRSVKDYSKLPKLQKYVENKAQMESEYEYFNKNNEIDTPADIIRHLRNAIAHKRLSIHPQPHCGQMQIRVIVFEDALDKHSPVNFRIAFKAEDLEMLLFEISDFLTGLEPNFFACNKL